MKSVSEIFNDCNEILDGIHNFVDRYIGCKLLRKCNITKLVDRVENREVCSYHDNPIFNMLGIDVTVSKIIEKCVSAKQLLIDKIILCFAAATAYMLFKTDTFYGDYKKDTFYRFDLMPNANWERLQLETASNVIQDIQFRTADNPINALIFDDTLYERRGGKGTDLCAKVYDHSDHKHRLGYRMMTGGWTNGEEFIPFSQVLLTTRDEKLMKGPDEPVDARTIRGKRRKRAKEKGTEVVIDMVRDAQKVNIPFDYVIFDTWFSNPSQLIALKAIGADTIAMIKKNSTKYTWVNPETGEESKLDVKEIYSRNKKRRGRSKYLLSVNVNVSDKNGNSISARLVYARNKNNRKQWVCFVCTDMTINEEEILQIYTLRWKIEVYFKMSKSYLKLREECHSTSYDAITAHMVIVALRYIILSMKQFNDSVNRSVYELFYGVQREIINEMINSAIKSILDALFESIRDYFGVSEKQIDELVCIFIDKLPDTWKRKFTKPNLVA